MFKFKMIGWFIFLWLFSLLSCTYAPSTIKNNEENTIVAVTQWPRINSPVKTDVKIEAKIASLISTMTLEQKVGQMIQAEIKYITPEQVKKYHIGSILNGGGSIAGRDGYASINEWLAHADAFYLASVDQTSGGVAIPLLWGTDSMHGASNIIGATIFPHNIGLGAANNPALIKQIAAATAKESLVSGVDWLFAPTVAVVRDDRWGRTYESFSEHPDIVEKYASAMIYGLQGEPSTDSLFAEDKILANVKHFIGDGGTDQGIDQGDTLVSEKTLIDIHAPGYFSALKAGAQVVMASFNSWQGEKVHGHQYLLNDVLKKQMGFDGFIVSDWNGHSQVDGCTEIRCAKAVNAGIDMFMIPSDWQAFYTNTIEEVEKGIISLNRIDDAVTRILRVKYRMGLFDKGLPSKRKFARQTQWLYHPEHQKIARQAVRESLVLLKNNERTLPLSAKSKVLIVGGAADDIGQASGGWTVTWQGVTNANEHFPKGTSIKQAIAQTVEAAKGTVEFSLDGSFDKKPDVAIFVYGEKPYAEMHGDLKTLEYQAGFHSDLAVLQKLQQQGIKTVSVFLSGRPLWVNAEINASDAFLAAWLPGSEGAGVSDVLFRKQDGSINFDFTGKLSFTWPNTAEQSVINYRDPDYLPLFPYGFGLNYQSNSHLPSLANIPDSTVTSSEHINLFVGRPLAPWQLLIKNKQLEQASIRSLLPVNIAGISSKTKDHYVQGDSKKIIWSGGENQVGLYSDTAINLSAYIPQSHLSIEMQVNEIPSGKTTFQLECGFGCKVELPMGEQLSEVLLNEWFELIIPLSCLNDKGANLQQVSAPFIVKSKGIGELTFSHIKITDKMGALKQKIVLCH